jgi:hypothetical protein
LDTQRLYEHRYDEFQKQQKAIMANYLHTVKGPEIERRVTEQEKVQQQQEAMLRQA